MTAVNVTTQTNTVAVTAAGATTVVETPKTTTVVLTTGPRGADGADGQGVPAGGSTGQVLAKIDGTDYNTQWADANTSAQSTAIALIFG